jgi:hypothetical protein
VATSSPTTSEVADRAVPADRGVPAGRAVRVLGILVLAAAAVLFVAGAATWVVVQGQLADERITVSDDADRFAGDAVDGPLTAYEQAQVIERHALASSDGFRYAELEQGDPRRAQVMNASFLRASLFTSVVSFGVAAMAMGLGLIFALVGVALLRIGRTLPPA